MILLLSLVTFASVCVVEVILDEKTEWKKSVLLEAVDEVKSIKREHFKK